MQINRTRGGCGYCGRDNHAAEGATAMLILVRPRATHTRRSSDAAIPADEIAARMVAAEQERD